MQTSNGLLEVFIDGIFIGEGRYQIPFRNTGDPSGFSEIEIATFMGGASTLWASPQDQWIYNDDMAGWMYNESADVPRGTTPSGPGRDISNSIPSEANFGR